MSDNLELWKRVEKTDPKHTKKANVAGNKITCIAPQYQILNATREFGSYGVKWGWKSLDLDYSLVSKDVIVLKGVFFYPDGEFPIINSMKLFKDNAKTKIDDDFAKKIETDALTKALSKLGFNADIFMGRYDDVKYLQEVTKEFAPKPKPVVKPVPKDFDGLLNAISNEDQKEYTKEWALKEYTLSKGQIELINKMELIKK